MQTLQNQSRRQLSRLNDDIDNFASANSFPKQAMGGAPRGLYWQAKRCRAGVQHGQINVFTVSVRGAEASRVLVSASGLARCKEEGVHTHTCRLDVRT